MNIKQAQYIQTIASEGSITAAAKKLYISQPSLSQMVRQVEKELGVTFRISGRRTADTCAWGSVCRGE